jgi:hypothetical protein
MAGLTVAIDRFGVGAHQTVQCRHATVGIIGFIAPRLKRAEASVVAIMFVCAAKLIRSTTLSDIAPSLSSVGHIFPASSNNVV